jgi:predicted Zn-dependent peptidase
MKRFYCSPNLLIAGTGAVSHKELVELTKRHFRLRPVNMFREDKIPESSGFSLSAHRNGTKQSHICFGFPGVGFNDPSRFAVSALNAYLSSGMSGRLFQKVREDTGYCYNVYSYLELFRDSGLFCVYYGSDNKYVVKAANIIFKELHHLKDKLLNRADLAKIKEQLKGSLVLSQESMYNRMNRIAQQELTLGKYIDPYENCRIIDGITARQIRDVANRIFDSNEMAFCSLGPIRKKELEKIRWPAL